VEYEIIGATVIVIKEPKNTCKQYQEGIQ